MQRGLVTGGQPHYCNWYCYLAAWFWSHSSHMVSTQSFLVRPRPVSCKPAQMGSCQTTDMRLWPATDHQPGCQLDMCLLTKFESRLQILHEAEKDTVKRLESIEGLHHSRNKMKWKHCRDLSHCAPINVIIELRDSNKQKKHQSTKVPNIIN